MSELSFPDACPVCGTEVTDALGTIGAATAGFQGDPTGATFSSGEVIERAACPTCGARLRGVQSDQPRAWEEIPEAGPVPWEAPVL
jgi:endogenous inhibitor of DNA gyrase (YacG/DUF329 family)